MAAVPVWQTGKWTGKAADGALPIPCAGNAGLRSYDCLNLPLHKIGHMAVGHKGMEAPFKGAAVAWLIKNE